MKIHDKDGLLVTNTSKFAFTDPSTKIRFESGETARVAYNDWLKSQPVMVLSDSEEVAAYAAAEAQKAADEVAAKAKELADAEALKLADEAQKTADAQKVGDEAQKAADAKASTATKTPAAKA